MEKFRNQNVTQNTQNLNETVSKNFFRYQIFSIQNPILFPIPNFYDTESDPFLDINFFCIETIWKTIWNQNGTLWLCIMC